MALREADFYIPQPRLIRCSASPRLYKDTSVLGVVKARSYVAFRLDNPCALPFV